MALEIATKELLSLQHYETFEHCNLRDSMLGLRKPKYGGYEVVERFGCDKDTSKHYCDNYTIPHATLELQLFASYFATEWIPIIRPKRSTTQDTSALSRGTKGFRLSLYTRHQRFKRHSLSSNQWSAHVLSQRCITSARYVLVHIQIIKPYTHG